MKVSEKQLYFLYFLGLYKEIPADLSPDERLLQLLDKSLLVRKLHHWMSAYPQNFVGATLSLVRLRKIRFKLLINFSLYILLYIY